MQETDFLLDYFICEYEIGRTAIEVFNETQQTFHAMLPNDETVIYVAKIHHVPVVVCDKCTIKSMNQAPSL